MSFQTYSQAIRQWVVDTYGTSFVVTITTVFDVAVFHDNQEVTPEDAPCVRFVYSHSLSEEGSPALTEGRGALICQIFTDRHIDPVLAEKIAGQIEDDSKRAVFTAGKGHFGPAHPQGPGSIEPEGLYQFNLRIPFWYLEAA